MGNLDVRVDGIYVSDEGFEFFLSFCPDNEDVIYESTPG